MNIIFRDQFYLISVHKIRIIPLTTKKIRQ